MTYARQTGLATARQRKRRRATVTLSLLVLLMLGAVGYVVLNTDELLGRKASTDPCDAPAQRVDVTVHNTTGEQGLASETASQLREKGFSVPMVGNDPLLRTVEGVGEIRYGREGGAQAKAVARHVPGARLVRDARDGEVVALVLGKEFQALDDSAPMAPTRPPEGCTPREMRHTPRASSAA